MLYKGFYLFFIYKNKYFVDSGHCVNMSKQTDSADSKNFAVNLKFLCGFYSSISEVCRRLEINRQQFNRYLSGKSFPSYKNYKTLLIIFVLY